MNEKMNQAKKKNLEQIRQQKQVVGLLNDQTNECNQISAEDEMKCSVIELIRFYILKHVSVQQT